MQRSTMLGTAVSVLRRRWREMLPLTVVAGIMLACGFCMVTVPFAVKFLGLAARAGLEPGTLRRTRSSDAALGLLAAIPFLPFLTSLVIGVSFLATLPAQGPLPSLFAIQMGAAVLGSVALAPWMGAASLYASRDITAGEALARSVASAIRAGALRTGGLGVLSGLAVSLPVLGTYLAPAAIAIEPPPYVLVMAMALQLLIVTVGSTIAWLLALSLGHALALGSSGSGVRASTLAIAPVLALAGTGLVAVWVSAPIWQVTAGQCPDRWSMRRDASVAFGDPSIELTLREDGLLVHPQTGFQSFIRAPRPFGWIDPEYSIGRGSVCRDDETGLISFREEAGRSLGTRLDARGNRLDDGPLDRLFARSNRVSDTALLLAVLAALAALLRARTRARLLPGEVKTFTVRLGDEDQLVQSDSRLVPHGDVRFQSADGTYVTRVDRPLPTASADREWRDGHRVHVVLPASLAELGPRQGAAALPAGAWIAPAPDDAEAARTLHLARAVSGFALASSMCVLVAAGAALLLL